MFFRRARNAAAALGSLMSQSRDTMVCFDFKEPIDPDEPQAEIDRKLRNCYVVEASRSFALYFGFKNREEVLGKPLMSLFPDGQVPDWFISYGNEVERRDFANIERVVSIPVGDELRQMRIHMQNIFDGRLLIRQWITIRDVSAEEENRRALEENERLKILALESVGLRTFSLDFDPLDTSQPHGVISVGGGAEPQWWENVHEEDKPILERAFARFYNGETERLHTLFRTSTSNADEVWMESWAVASNRDSQQRPQGIVGVIMDRTQSKALEAKLIANQRLESLGVLAGGIAHDFNNLLMAVTGAVDVALHKQPQLSEELRLIDDAARQATLLCDQLLTYAGRGSAELSLLNFSTALEGFRDLLVMNAHKNAKVQMHIEQDCWVKGDSSQLSQVAMNLIKNASDALTEGTGQITVDLREVDYDDSWRVDYHLGGQLQPGRYAALTVTDTGKGMSAGEREHLFDPFFTTKFTGRGLGMAVVMGVVRGHGGAIHVDSTQQEGTSIRVVLPARSAAEEAQTVSELNPIERLQGCVLVVDDEDAVREVARSLITAMGMEAVVASGGYDALQQVTAAPHKFDAILMDVTMPELDGVETASRILDQFPTTQIIMCSGYSNVTMPPKLADAVSFLQKPYRLSQLQEKLTPIVSKA